MPEGYVEIFSVDLKNNKRLMLLVNGIALVIAALLAVPMCFLVPIAPLFSMDKGMLSYMLRFGGLIVFSILYILLHELVHGVAMRLCGTKRVKYGFTGLYAFAGSSDFYGKGAYIFIALAPVVLWGIVLAVVNVLVPIEWFWVIYFLQIFNLSGAAGDFYVTAKFSAMPSDILVSDSGVSMRVYAKNKGPL